MVAGKVRAGHGALGHVRPDHRDHAERLPWVAGHLGDVRELLESVLEIGRRDRVGSCEDGNRGAGQSPHDEPHFRLIVVARRPFYATEHDGREATRTRERQPELIGIT